MSDGIYRRYFRVKSGPVLKEAKRLYKINAAARAEYISILEDIGARSDEWYQAENGRLTAILFDKAPDRAIYKKVKNGWYPKVTSEKGKPIVTRLKSVETAYIDGDIREMCGFGRTGFDLWGSRKAYSVGVIYIPGDRPKLYLTVPWKDVEELWRYQKLRKADKISRDSTLDHLLWKPDEHMIEVKHWQLEKAIDAHNAKVAGGGK